jgi:hypothetical protein
MENCKIMVNTSYSLNPNRDRSWMVVDMFDEEVGREGIYSGTYDDCQIYMAEYAKHCSCIGMDIVPNPYYRKE